MSTKRKNGTAPTVSPDDVSRSRSGRPSLYKPQYVGIAAKMFAAGATMAELAMRFGVAESTVYLWARQHPEFSEAIKEAGRIADERM